MVATRLDCAVVMMLRVIALSLALGFVSTPAAAGFLDWWLTPDQQGRLFYQRGDYQRAARSFEDEQWKAQAFYSSGDFANAAVLFAKDETAAGFFNLGNALSKQEKLGEAIAAYEQALALQPDFPEAAFNLDWVTGLKEVDEKEYDDAGGTGGKLKADRTVMDETGAKAQTEISDREFKADSGMTDEQIQSMWMQRVQTTPADFLQFKFSYQLGQQEQAATE
jgi:Ca-activated chloride channel family protein